MLKKITQHFSRERLPKPFRKYIRGWDIPVVFIDRLPHTQLGKMVASVIHQQILAMGGIAINPFPQEVARLERETYTLKIKEGVPKNSLFIELAARKKNSNNTYTRTKPNEVLLRYLSTLPHYQQVRDYTEIRPTAEDFKLWPYVRQFYDNQEALVKEELPLVVFEVGIQAFHLLPGFDESDVKTYKKRVVGETYQAFEGKNEQDVYAQFSLNAKQMCSTIQPIKNGLEVTDFVLQFEYIPGVDPESVVLAPQKVVVNEHGETGQEFLISASSEQANHNWAFTLAANGSPR